MAEYGQFADTRQSAQDVDLYHFFRGNDSATGTSAVQSTGELGPCCGDVPDLTYGPSVVYAVDAFGGPDAASIAGRFPDGGGSAAQARGTWRHVAASGTAIGTSGNTAVRTSGSGSDAHYVLTDATARTDYGVEAIGHFGAAPGANTWFSVLARHRLDDETGVELRLTKEFAGSPALVLLSYMQSDGLPVLVANEISSVLLPPLGTDDHTVRLDCIGDQFFGYLDGVLQLTASIGDFEFIDEVNESNPNGAVKVIRHTPIFDTGLPGLCMSTQGTGHQVFVTQFRVGSPGAIPSPAASGVRQLVARDGFDGNDVTDIEGRTLDGGGTPSASQGNWSKLGTSNFHISIQSGTAHQTTQTVLPLTQAIYLAEGLTLPDDYSVECVMQITKTHTIPNFRDNWITLRARTLSSANTGYEAFFQFFPTSTGLDPVVIGGMEFYLYKMTAGGYTQLAYNLDYHGTPDLGVDHTLGLCITGNVLAMYFDGDLVLQATDSTYPTGGFPGLGMLDGFSVGPVPVHGDGSTFAVKEWSVYAVDPSFVVQDTEASLDLNYTTADVPITFRGDEYEPFVGIRTSFNQGTGERGAFQVDLRCPFDHPIAQLAMESTNEPVGCAVYRLDRQDLADDAAAVPMQGQIVHHEITPDRWCVVTIGNAGSLLTSKLPRMLTQRTCPHVLGGPFCQVNIADFTHTNMTVSAIAGRQVTVSGASAIGDATFFERGVLVTAEGVEEFIEQQEGDVLTLKQEVPGLEAEDTVTLIAGCDHKARTCDTRFANIVHFGGEIGIPDQNPSTGAGLVGPGSVVENV